PHARVLPFPTRFDPASARELLPRFDSLVDGSDNLATKFLVNDAAVLAGRPFVIGGAVRFCGQLLAWRPGHACYRCLFEAPPPAGTVETCSEAGILGPICGVVGALQAAAVLALAGHPPAAGAPVPG